MELDFSCQMQNLILLNFLTVNCVSIMRALNMTNAPQCETSSDRQSGREKQRKTTGRGHTIAGGEEVCWSRVGIMFLHNHHGACGNTGNILVKGNNKHCLLGTQAVNVSGCVLISVRSMFIQRRDELIIYICSKFLLAFF